MTDKTKPTKELIYDAGKGLAWLREGDKVRRVGRGYSGQPPFVNDTGAERLRARGPIPRGSYRVHRPFDHVRLGPLVMFLEPLNSEQMFGRSGFFIHGDNSFGNNSASHGCIILPRAARDEIAKAAPITLTVVGE